MGLNKKTSTIFTCTVIILTVLVLSLIYMQRMVNSSLPTLSTSGGLLFLYSVVVTLLFIYGIVVTPFLLTKIIMAYRYKPVPDRGYRPYISVIVPVLNEGKVISRTIRALLDSEYPKEKLEIIVVNDGSTDNTEEEIMKFPEVKYVNLSKNMGKRHAFAKGVKEFAHGEFMICVDSDSIVDKKALMLLVQPFTDHDVMCACGHGDVLNKKHSLLTWLQRVWYADGFRLIKAFESQFNMVTCCSGLLAAYRKSGLNSQVLNKWLNETFMGQTVIDSDDRRMTNLLMKSVINAPGEDVTLTNFAMKKRYAKSMYQSNAIAYTVVPDNTKTFVRQQLRWGRGSFRGMLFAATFFWRRPLKQSLLFYLSTFVNYGSPFILLLNLIVLPLMGFWYPAVIYSCGLLLIHFIHGLTDNRLLADFTYKYVFYRTIFVGLSTFISLIYLYAWVTAWQGKKWMTREMPQKTVGGTVGFLKTPILKLHRGQKE